MNLNDRTVFIFCSGPKLLSAVTCLNYTPLQLAETEEMFSLLSSFLPQPRRVSDSQEFSFSQGRGYRVTGIILQIKRIYVNVLTYIALP